jgi:hypothetical protein
VRLGVADRDAGCGEEELVVHEPRGLGTFEATQVLMLRMVGIDLAVALSATLLFRGLSFWLPMLPGHWFSRRAVAPHRPAETSRCTTNCFAISTMTR